MTSLADLRFRLGLGAAYVRLCLLFAMEEAWTCVGVELEATLTLGHTFRGLCRYHGTMKGEVGGRDLAFSCFLNGRRRGHLLLG